MANINAFRPALPDLRDIVSTDDFFGTAKRKFPLYLSDGYYRQQDEPCIFIQRITKAGHSHTGIIACAHVQDYIDGHIKKHEHTLAAKELQMTDLFKERNGVIKPIMLTYPNVLEIDALINRITVALPYSFRIPYEDEVHTFWQISDPAQLERIKLLFQKHVKASYICDGHHRAVTAEKLYETYGDRNNPDNPYNYLMAAYFPASEIVINNFNRVLTSLKGVKPDNFLERLSSIYHIEEEPIAFRPANKHQMGLYLDECWYRLFLREAYTPDPKSVPVEECLDVHLFNKYVLQHILGIEDVRLEDSIKYVEGVKGPAALERRVDGQKVMAAFNLYPVALEDLIAISDMNGTMPPKSTYIEPRMRNGFVAQLYT
jgi:uncharacterized protein (DUF1015 family)